MRKCPLVLFLFTVFSAWSCSDNRGTPAAIAAAPLTPVSNPPSTPKEDLEPPAELPPDLHPPSKIPQAPNSCLVQAWDLPAMEWPTLLPLRCEGKAQTLTGILESYSELGPKEENTHFFLREKNGSLRPVTIDPLLIASKDLGKPVDIEGYPCGATFVVTRLTSLTQIFETTPHSLGQQNVASIIVNYSDSLHPSTTTPEAIIQLFSEKVLPYFKEVSYGKTWLHHEVLGTITLPFASSSCWDIFRIGDYIQEQAKQRGWPVEKFNRFIYAMPRSKNCAWLGHGRVGSPRTQTWINGFDESYYFKIATHELGHNMGLWHATTLNCQENILSKTGCKIEELGDRTDTMGSGYMAHYNAFYKERLGWLSPNGPYGITTIKQSGTYLIQSMSRPEPGTKALRVEIPRSLAIIPPGGDKDFSLSYYLEYRTPHGFDSVLKGKYPTNFTNGIIVHLNSPVDKSLLLNMVPADKQMWSNVALEAGKSFHDWYNGILIEVLSLTDRSARVRITLGTPLEETPKECKTNSERRIL